MFVKRFFADIITMRCHPTSHGVTSTTWFTLALISPPQLGGNHSQPLASWPRRFPARNKAITRQEH
eukprot:6162895-Amphidinium_carterae.2